MDKNLYTKTIDSIRISDEAVENAIKNLKQPGAVGKVIEMKKSKHRFIKPIGAVAAALAIIIGAGLIFNLGSMPEQGTNNGFFITANAAATDDEPVEINEEFTVIGSITPDIQSWASLYNTLSDVTVGAEFNLNCVGDNIETITYKVNNGDNNGAIALFDNNTKIVDYGTKNKWFHGGSESREENGITSQCFYYDYVTVDYDNQFDTRDYWSKFIVYYEPKSDEESAMMLSFLNDTDDIESKSLKMNVGEVKKRVNDFYQNIFRDTEVVVTATYNDGSMETKTLNLGVDKIIVHDDEGKEITDETLSYKENYDYKLTMTAKLV